MNRYSRPPSNGSMKRMVPVLSLLGAGMAFCSCATKNSSESGTRPVYYYSQPKPGYGSGSSPDSTELAEVPWPRVVVRGSITNLIYQPQADFWDGHQLTARDAIGVQRAGQLSATFGVVTLKALTLVDKTKRLVTLEEIQIAGGYFPSVRPEAQDYLAIVRETFPKQLAGLSLDRLEASFVPTQSLNRTSQPLNNVPPKIVVFQKPAILVLIDGPPACRPIPGTKLQRVINTRLLLLKDETERLYLHVFNGYLEAPSLEGPWSVAGHPPLGATEAEKLAAESANSVDLLSGQTEGSNNPPSVLNEASAPAVYVSTKPAELILFDGQPNFLPISGTHLLYAANTTGNVFKLLSDQQTYVLLSGRWFRAASLDGPWQFVPANHLPRDFADIPDNSPKENVKASVPGTQQAAEALIANTIPESTVVPRAIQMQNPRIDGAPRLKPVAGTPLEYVENSGTPIIKVDEHSWYGCQNGVWFEAASLDGPWAVAASVPALIYSIPPSSPLHYLTYVQVYGATPQEVYEGYTPGYMGTEVEDGLVVYGTGYYYPPWIGAEWYGCPWTWGFGWAPCWTPWDDWCFDFGFGWGCGFGRFGWWRCHPTRPWWGPGRFRNHEGRSFAWRREDTASTAGNIYSRPISAGRPSVTSDAGNSRLPGGYARAYNSRTGGLSAGQRASIQNVHSGFSGSLYGPASVEPRGARSFGSAESGYGIGSSAGGTFHGAGPGSRASGYYNGGYSRGYSRGGGYSHGGWGGGGHGGGGGGHGGGGHGGGGR